MAMDNFKNAADTILKRAVASTPRVPGVVAMATDRRGNFYEGVAGERVIGGPAMTFDSVFAIHSTTKAITGTAVLQAVEEGKIDLDAPAKNYIPDVGKLQVIEGFDQAGKSKLRAPKRDITTRMLMLHTAGFWAIVLPAAVVNLLKDKFAGHLTPSTSSVTSARNIG
jgi:methyl acetate hydrolase